MGGACCLHDTGVQKLTLNMLCSFLTSPGEGRPQHYITMMSYGGYGVQFDNLFNANEGKSYDKFTKVSPGLVRTHQPLRR